MTIPIVFLKAFSHVLCAPIFLNIVRVVIFQISGGWRHTMALTSDGKLYGWGWNKVWFLFL